MGKAANSVIKKKTNQHLNIFESLQSVHYAHITRQKK